VFGGVQPSLDQLDIVLWRLDAFARLFLKRRTAKQSNRIAATSTS
jgi:hypothetical protein